MPLGETIISPATGSMGSAIAMIRLSGPYCERAVADCFGLLKKIEPRVAYFGRYKNLQNIIVDEVVYTFYRGNKSYTGEDMLEICCHGNPLIVRKIVEDLIARGCRMAEGGEFTRTAYLNKKLDLSQAEAVCDIITAKSEKGIQVAQRQLSGALGKKIADYIDIVLQLMAEVEAYIDFPEDDLPEENKSKIINALAQLTVDFQALISTQKYKEILQNGIKTVIVGAPNAGKSSLLNALIGEDRALVSDLPGTTRDFIAENIMIGAYCIRIIDTAGLRENAAENIERAGIEKTKDLIKQADIKILVVDAAVPYPDLADLLDHELCAKTTLLVENKLDLEKANQEKDPFVDYSRINISLKTNEGFSLFKEKLEALIASQMNTDEGEGVVVNARHVAALTEAQSVFNEVIQKIEQGEGAEFVAADLRVAIEALGDIVGRIDNERMLDKLFSTFCIGK